MEIRHKIVALGLFLAVFLASCASPRVQKGLSPPAEALESKPLRYSLSIDKKKNLFVEEVDTDGDGVLDEFSFRSGASSTSDRRITQADLQKQGCKRLILCLDSVPHGTMKRLWREGYFREFYPPSAMISPFPSMTFLSFSEIFRSGKALCYEDSYFDRKANKMAGGMAEHLHPARIASFYNYFDYKTPGLQAGTIYFAPHSVMSNDFNRMRDSFKLLEKQNEVISYVGGMDAIAHKLGEEGLAEYLRYVDLVLREVFVTSPEPLRIVVFSDHGNNYVPSEPIPLDEFLKKHFGIKELDKRLGRTDRPSVILPAYGLVNFAVIFTEDGNEEQLGEFLTGIKGVDLVVFSRDGAAVVWSRKGRARILGKEGSGFRVQGSVTQGASPSTTFSGTGVISAAYKYQCEKGDPLEMMIVVQRLKDAGKLDAEGYASANDWFEATKEHKYIDGIHRVHEAATDLVENHANLILSLDDGCFYGSKFFNYICELKGTHGSLERKSSLGFVMTNYKRLPAYVRSSDMADAVELPKAPRSATGRNGSDQ